MENFLSRTGEGEFVDRPHSSEQAHSDGVRGVPAWRILALNRTSTASPR